MAPLTILRWSLLAGARRPLSWLFAALAVFAWPLLQRVPQLSGSTEHASDTGVFYELAFVFSLAGASLSLGRVHDAAQLVELFAPPRRWLPEILAVLGHASVLAWISSWPLLFSSVAQFASLASAGLMTGLFWAGLVCLLRSLRLPIPVQGTVLLGTGALILVGVPDLPALPLLRGTQIAASTHAIFTPAALAADVASIISLFAIAWCLESSLLRRS